MKIIFATHNAGKVKEIADILSGLNIEIVSADDAGVTEDVVEDGDTFEANALKKAVFVGEKTGEWVMADDSGICVRALGGAPGIYSARWAGEGAPPEKVVEKILTEMKDVPEGKRDAWFETVAVLRAPDAWLWSFRGVVEGEIVTEPRGEFRPKLPYDIVFQPLGFDKTFAEMTSEEKNQLSHRGRAFKQLGLLLEKRRLFFESCMLFS